MTAPMDVQTQRIVKKYQHDKNYAQLQEIIDDLEEDELWQLLVLAEEKGDYDLGVIVAMQLLTYNPYNYELYHEIGYFLAKKQRTKEAKTFYLQAIELNQLNHASYYNLAELYIASKNYTAARNALEQAITLDATNMKYSIQLAKVCTLQRKYDLALDLYMDIIEQMDSQAVFSQGLSAGQYTMLADVYYDVALIYIYVKKDLLQADVYLQRYEELMPYDADAKRLRMQLG